MTNTQPTSCRNPLVVWCTRVLLLITLPIALYIAIIPDFFGWEYIPRRLITSLGFSYHSLLWFEQNLASMLHLIGAFMLTLLLPLANLFYNQNSSKQIITSAILVFISGWLLEIIQGYSGRGYETQDLLYHSLGIIAALGVELTIILVRQKLLNGQKFTETQSKDSELTAQQKNYLVRK